MLIRFCGAAGEVTGSCHYVEADGLKCVLDCGLFQGGGKQFDRNDVPFPFEAADVDFALLSHAHIDHVGRLPLLVKRGFKGTVLATPATADLVEVLLRDSAHIQEEDARWKIKRLRKRGKDASWVRTLYSAEDAERALSLVRAVQYDEEVSLNGAATACWRNAGHILGSAHVELTVRENGRESKLVYSGDVGGRGSAIVKDPTRIPHADFVLVESTYGNRLHKDTADRPDLFRGIVTETIQRGGKVIIPSFAVERTQELLYDLNPLMESGSLGDVPVFVDSPMAVDATKIFEKHVEDYDADATAMLRGGDDPLDFPGLHLVRDVAKSKALSTFRKPCVIISASGMCTAGRIKHHLKNHMGDPKNTILFVGFQAHGSLGQQIRDGNKEVRIFGEMHNVVAQVATIDGFSAHADSDGLLWWLDGFEAPPRHVYVIHGEKKASRAFADAVAEKKGWPASTPAQGDETKLE